MKTRFALIVAFLLVSAGCSPGGSTADPAVDALAPSDGADRRSDETDKGRDRRAERKPKDSKKNESKGHARSKGRTEDGGSGGSGPRQALATPAEGTYSYAQTGWEEICQATRCDRSDLPPTQSIEISVTARSPERVRFTSRSDGAGSRSQTIHYLATQDLISVTELENRFTASGFTISSVIVPDPPIKVASLPWTVGDRWAGTWTDRNDQADGTYRFEVTGTERMPIDGTEETVFIVDTFMELSGEYEGTNEMRLWVTQDFTIASSKGTTKIKSRYGTYRSRFTTFYRSGPRS
jgi:hypothetical protein